MLVFNGMLAKGDRVPTVRVVLKFFSWFGSDRADFVV